MVCNEMGIKFVINGFDMPGNAWINTVRDYEDNELGEDLEYPDIGTLIAQKKARYGFTILNFNEKILEFDSEKHYHWFLLKWAT